MKISISKIDITEIDIKSIKKLIVRNKLIICNKSENLYPYQFLFDLLYLKTFYSSNEADKCLQ